MTPGLHSGIPAEVYHADCCPRPSLSSSIAQVLLSESPRKAFFSHPRLNPDFRGEHESKFDLGTACHAVLLENDASKIAVIDPQDYPGKKGGIPDGWTNDAIRAARDAARASGRTPLLKHNYDDVREMVDAALAFIESTEIAEAWHAGESEVTGISLEPSGVWLRCRFDKLAASHQIIFDYKSTVDASPEPFSRLLVRMGYHVQDAFYRRVARALGIAAPKFIFLAQSVEPPYECSLHACDPALAEIADAEVERAIRLWGQCMRTNTWPSYGPQIHYALPTGYMMSEHEIRMAA